VVNPNPPDRKPEETALTSSRLGSEKGQAPPVSSTYTLALFRSQDRKRSLGKTGILYKHAIWMLDPMTVLSLCPKEIHDAVIAAAIKGEQITHTSIIRWKFIELHFTCTSRLPSYKSPRASNCLITS
jgi:hypothetical protein